jgi:hypothetical protein
VPCVSPAHFFANARALREVLSQTARHASTKDLAATVQHIEQHEADGDACATWAYEEERGP